MRNELIKLLAELGAAYLESDIQRNSYCRENNRKWAYELIQTALEENQPLIIGFNWGVDNSWDEYINGNEYNHQQTIEEVKFIDIYKGSIERAMNMCKTYFKEIEFGKGSHSNFCFFQSAEENQISKKDIELCVPIFNKMINIVKPSVVFCFSRKAMDYLIRQGLARNIKREKFSPDDGNGRSCYAAKGELDDGVKIYFLPHPNSRLKKKYEIKHGDFVVNQRRNSAVGSGERQRIQHFGRV